MDRQKSRYAPFTLDMYDEATGPMGRVVLPPTTPLSPSSPPSQVAMYSAPSTKYRGSPPGGSAAVYWSAQMKRYRRSPIPGLMRAGLALVQLVLLARVVCLVLNVQATTPWLVLLFAASDLFVVPVRWFAVNINLSWLASMPLLTNPFVEAARWFAANINLSWLTGTSLLTNWEFVVAIPVYGLFSWLLVRLLRVLLNH